MQKEVTIKIVEDENGAVDISAEFDPPYDNETDTENPFSHEVAMKMLSSLGDAAVLTGITGK